MTSVVKTQPLSRRTVLAGALAGALVPRRLRAQDVDAFARIRCAFSDQEIVYRLVDNPTVRDFLSILPLDLTIEDYSTNEKLAHLPRRLDEGGLVDFDDERPGDLCYFLGWGNLAFFHGDYDYRENLFRLGHIDGEIDPLLVRGEYPLRIERA